ncbi:trace amine-associated receptor 13c-like protein [Lates japonicus]|uniref:Trace amine-associated receptor 13c-like protein n=1 Tax=Lates japonicus TaxID=270547 RepID=A0AAD3M147_LATJO|nr:trace amine-associated receptor 13c-like protein [Lates japonicus]
MYDREICPEGCGCAASPLLLSLMMETLEGAELCFPQLRNTSCKKHTQSHSEPMLTYILLSSISLLTAALNLLVLISIFHFRQR